MGGCEPWLSNNYDVWKEDSRLSKWIILARVQEFRLQHVSNTDTGSHNHKTAAGTVIGHKERVRLRLSSWDYG